MLGMDSNDAGEPTYHPEKVLLGSSRNRLAEATQLLRQCENVREKGLIVGLINCADLAIADQLEELEGE